MSAPTIPIEIDDPINAAILAVSEDSIRGFVRSPLAAIAAEAGIETEQVIERIQAMLRGGVIRRVRQTMLATSLAPGALVAWQIPNDRLNAAFDWMFQEDPFSGHVVIRTADPATPGALYRLWTTLKVPTGFSMDAHCRYLCEQTGAEAYRLMPAKKLFVLGVGHMRRRGLPPGSKIDGLSEVQDTAVVTLTDHEWRIMSALKRELEPEELVENLWQARAEEAGVSLEEFCQVAESLNERGVVGRFSTFLEHVKPSPTGQRVTRFNALFHWAVPPGREMEAGQQLGRFHCMTHAYWREGGPEFRNVNIMGVTHGTDKNLVLAHKAAIDQHFEERDIPVSYTNVFWGGRSEIKPSEVSPYAYRDWCGSRNLDPETMRG